MLPSLAFGIISLVWGYWVSPDTDALEARRQEGHFCWTLEFEDNFHDRIQPQQIDYMDLTLCQGDRMVKANYAESTGKLEFLLGKAALSKGSVSLTGHCWRRLSTSRIQIWKFDLQSLPIERRKMTLDVPLINVNTI